MIPLKPEYHKTYRRVFLVQDRAVWAACPEKPAANDLVLSFDYGVVRDVRQVGCQAGILDHVVSAEAMERFNFDVYKFFDNWYRDAQGKDIFRHMDVPFGDCFRQEVWSDVSYPARVAICLLAIKGLQAESFWCCLQEPIAGSFALRFGLVQNTWSGSVHGKKTYYFPVFAWMDMMIRPAGLTPTIKILLRRLHSFLSGIVDILLPDDPAVPAVYIQHYFPTNPVIYLADKEKNLKIYLDGFVGERARKYFRNTLPVPRVTRHHRDTAVRLLDGFDRKHYFPLVIDGVDIGTELYRILRERIAPRLPEYVATMEALTRYFSRRRLDVIVLIANLGMKANMLLALGKKKKIPSYLIINGCLSGDFLSESRNADWINAYGVSIKHHYYKDAANVVSLGDPRMDAYVEAARNRRRSQGGRTHIVIGASGYDSIHLYGYLCGEFDFLRDVLDVCVLSRQKGHIFDITLKVRKNGYAAQYVSFCEEFYPDLRVAIVDAVPMMEVLAKADLFVTLCSGTHFEAALLGIPSVYYKKDGYVMDPPFDGDSELPTAWTTDELEGYFNKFFSGETVGREFRDRPVLEKYVGPLDGNNARRNLDFILQLASGRQDGSSCS